jgi:hypothetical protein
MAAAIAALLYMQRSGIFEEEINQTHLGMLTAMHVSGETSPSAAILTAKLKFRHGRRRLWNQSAPTYRAACRANSS